VFLLVFGDFTRDEDDARFEHEEDVTQAVRSSDAVWSVEPTDGAVDFQRAHTDLNVLRVTFAQRLHVLYVSSLLFASALQIG